MKNLRKTQMFLLRLFLIGGFVTILTSGLFVKILLATPPDPPVKISIEVGAIEPVEIKLRDGKLVLHIKVSLRDNIEPSLLKKITDMIIVRATRTPIETEITRVVKPDFEKELKLIKESPSQEINLLLSPPTRGDEKLEIWAGIKDKDAAIDRKIRYLRSKTRDSVTLFTPKQYEKELKKERWNKFWDHFKKFPSDADIRLLWPRTKKIQDVNISAILEVKEQILVRPKGPSDGLKMYIKESEDQSWDSSDPLTIRGRLTYQDFDGIWRPLVNVSVNIWDSDTGPDEHLGTVGTDWNGYWSFSCNNDDGLWQDGRDIYYSFKLENTRWRVQDCGPWPDSTYEWESSVHNNLKDGSVVDFGTETGSGDNGPMIVWQFLNRAWNHVVVYGQQDPGFVDCCFPENNTRWDRFWEEIDVEQQYTDGPDVVTHEYGHALMWYAYDEDNPSPGGSHNFGQVQQDSGLAWSEGWATGWMLSVCPDGEYNWHEGTTEGNNEYPSCVIQNDFGRDIEAFSSTNRKGELNEGRVAAAINDLLDAPNDSNGGNENLGRSDKEDGNSAYRIPLSKMYRDVMWGGWHEDFLQFWSDLAGELSGDMYSLARDACQYNWMSISGPIVCAAEAVTNEINGKEEILRGIRIFRDYCLKDFPGGRLLVQSYYRNSPELTGILSEDKEARDEALKVLKYFSKLGVVFSDNKAYEELLRSDEPIIPNDMNSIIIGVFERLEKHASTQLSNDLKEVKASYEKLNKLSLREIQLILQNKKVK